MKQNKLFRSIHKFWLGFLTILVAFFVIQNIFANSLEFQSSLFDWNFTDTDKTYSTVHYNKSGNNFPWLFLRNEPAYLWYEQEVIINGSSKFCNQQIQGLYYNNTRGARLRPLSPTDLAELQSKDSSYDNLSIAGWLYTKCIDEDKYQIYGQLTHTRNWTDYKLIAWVEISDATYNPNFENNFKLISSTGAISTGVIFDTYGGVATLIWSWNMQIPIYVDIPASNHWSANTLAVFTGLGYIQGNGALISISPWTLVGSTWINLAQNSSGKICPMEEIIFQTTWTLAGNTWEVQFPNCFIVKNSIWEPFSGLILTPHFENTNLGFSLINHNIKSLFKVGPDESINFETTGWITTFATFRIPTPNTTIWDIITISYSTDTQSRTTLKTWSVTALNWENYVTFTGSHFTYFSLWTKTGNFVINNDDLQTNFSGVTLNMTVSWATEMRFGNSEAEKNSASWIGYETGYARNLNNTGGTKTVYAEFKDTNGTTGTVSDDIILTASTDLRITKIPSWTFTSGEIIEYQIQYGNSWSDTVSNIEITEIPTTRLSGLNYAPTRTNEWDWTFTTTITEIIAWTSGSLVFTAVLLTWDEEWFTINNTVSLTGDYIETNTEDNIYTIWFITIDTNNPNIYFTGSTPTSGAISWNTTFTGNIEIIESTLKKLIRNRNGTDYIFDMTGWFDNFGTGNYSLTDYERKWSSYEFYYIHNRKRT